ncbi:uncharacterized protein TNCT_350921 [Trichonephila clavata]|uniref:Uncharacterized protein n=1 Tax=Trichonephila clavata TaxID=2740835 RepID=A0A8X6F3W2_TRICU|nr:uncharacterized protein TNCT_350921 [Trichonephila clavata]
MYSYTKRDSSDSDSTIIENNKAVKLPKLSINKCYGDYSQWLDFFNPFESAIDNNNSIAKREKLNYLKSYLGGTAASYIREFSLTEVNYDVALD